MTLAPLASLSLAGAMLAADAPPSVKVLSLANAEETALRHQPTLEQAFGQVEAAEGRVEQARAGYLPQLNGAATYQRTTANFAPRPGLRPDGRQRAAERGMERPDLQLLHLQRHRDAADLRLRPDQRALALGERQPRRRRLEPARDREPDVAERAARVLPGTRAARSGRGRRGRRAQPGEAPRTERRAGEGRHPPRHRHGDGADRAGERARAAGQRPEQLRRRRRRSWRRRWASS